MLKAMFIAAAWCGFGVWYAHHEINGGFETAGFVLCYMVLLTLPSLGVGTLAGQPLMGLLCGLVTWACYIGYYFYFFSLF
jgi:hypothetical protein